MIKKVFIRSKYLAICSVLAYSSSFAEEIYFPNMVDLSISNYGKRLISEAALFAPITSNNNQILLLDTRLKHSSKSTTELDLGLVYRSIIKSNYIIGWNNYYNYGTIKKDASFAQWNTGIELLSENWDFRINAYFPHKKNPESDENLNEYSPLPGYHFEIGMPVFIFSEHWNNKIGTKLFISKYRFHKKNVDTKDGIRFKLEQQLITNLFSDSNSSLLFLAGYDKYKGGKGEQFATLKLRFELGAYKYRHNKYYHKNSKIHSRMSSSISRDFGVVTNNLFAHNNIIENENIITFNSGLNNITLTQAINAPVIKRQNDVYVMSGSPNKAKNIREIIPIIPEPSDHIETGEVVKRQNDIYVIAGSPGKATNLREEKPVIPEAFEHTETGKIIKRQNDVYIISGSPDKAEDIRKETLYDNPFED